MKNFFVLSVNFVKNWWFPWLILGLILRLLLMPFTLHPDLLGHSFSAHFLVGEGKWNLYETLANLPPTHPLVRDFGVADIFIYPPLAYYTLGFFRILVKPFSDPTFIPWLMDNLDQIHFYPGLSREIFLFKLPYLFVDIATAFLLSAVFTDVRKRKWAFILWLFNPLTLYATFMIGQLDILPVFFTVLSVLLAAKDKPGWSLFSLGLGGSYKMYPLLFIPVMVFILRTNFWSRFRLMFIGFLPFILLVFPYLSSKAFRAMVLFAPKSQKMLFMGWPVSGAEVVFPFIILLSLLYFFAYYQPRKYASDRYLLAGTLMIFSVTHYHPQWFLWATPFLILELVENNFRHGFLVLVLLASWLVITLFFEPSLSYGLFNPVWPELEKAKGLAEIVGKYFDIYLIKSLVRSVFAGAAIFLVWKNFREKVNA